MATSSAVLKGLSNVNSLSKFIANPKKYITSQGLDPNDPEVAATYEMYARSLINNINAANSTVGSGQVKVQWGIGASCCNKAAFKKLKKA
jgi:hypothetical protein